jgi:hypothetical protein
MDHVSGSLWVTRTGRWHDGLMIIPGYLDGFIPDVDPSTVVDATGWLDDPTFWPAHLLTVGGAKDAPGAFDVDLADLDAMLDELQRPDRWPAFTLSVGDRHEIHLIWRNFDGDAGADYLITRPGSDTSIVVAALEGHFIGPAWSWRELLTIAGRPDPRRSVAERLLILLPAMGDTDLPPAAVTLVAAAVTAVGGSRNQVEVARQLLAAGGRFWGATPWHHRDGISICLGGHSRRGDRRIAEALGLR